MRVYMGGRSSWELSAGDEIAQGARSVMRLLGGGRRYEAYLVWEERMLAPMVAKLIRPDQAEEASALRALQREADALAALAHPVILRGFDAVLDPPHPHVLVEHLEGPTLRELLTGGRTLPAERVRTLGRHVASALHYMAGEGWLHLDLKPSNIMMGAPPRVIDLSLARTVKRAARVREPIGTNAYMAPEQCLPAGELSPAADVWGLGATLYHGAGGPAPVSEARPRGALPAAPRGRAALAVRRAGRAVRSDPRLPAARSGGAPDGGRALRKARVALRKAAAFLARTVRAVTLLARDERVPRALRGIAAIGLLPIPGPVDEVVLILIAPVFLILYPEPTRDAWARTYRQATPPDSQ